MKLSYTQRLSKYSMRSQCLSPAASCTFSFDKCSIFFQLARFQAFDHSIRDINTLFEAWDRTTGSVFISESEKSDMEQDAVPVPVGKKGLASHKKMEKEKEKEREKEREREKEKSKEASSKEVSWSDLLISLSIISFRFTFS